MSAATSTEQEEKDLIKRIGVAALILEADLKEIENKLVVLKVRVAKQNISPGFLSKELDDILMMVRR